MRSRGLVFLISALVVGGTTAGGIAAGGAGHSRGDDAAQAQYTPGGAGEKNGKKTCRDLVTSNRNSERAIHARNTRLLHRLHGRQRRRLARFLQREERALHTRNVRAERQCRNNGGAKVRA
jgi:hypothetical protein